METNAQHYTNASFHKTLYTLGKICATSDKTTTTKTTSRKKPKKHRENQKNKKNQKNLGFQGKVLGVTSPKSLGVFLFFFCFFWFSRVFFFFFFVFFGLLEFFFWFFGFFKRFLRSVFGSASIWIVHNRFCADCTFSTELCARCPTACL